MGNRTSYTPCASFLKVPPNEVFNRDQYWEMASNYQILALQRQEFEYGDIKWFVKVLMGRANPFTYEKFPWESIAIGKICPCCFGTDDIGRVTYYVWGFTHEEDIAWWLLQWG